MVSWELHLTSGNLVHDNECKPVPLSQTLTAMLAREMGLDAAWLGRTRPRLWLYVVQESKHVLGAVWAERRLVRLAAQPSDDHPTQVQPLA